jgi:hypothetical protein
MGVLMPHIVGALMVAVNPESSNGFSLDLTACVRAELSPAVLETLERLSRSIPLTEIEERLIRQPRRKCSPPPKP